MNLKRLPIFLALLTLSVGLTVAADTAPCTRPLVHLDCNDLARLEKTKGCVKEQLATPAVAPVVSENTCTNTREVITNTIEVPGPTNTLTMIQNTEVPVQRGQFLLGGGPLFLNKLGVTALFGYQFRKTGIILLGGPLFVPNDGGRDSYDVTVRDNDQFNAPPGWIKNGKACGQGPGHGHHGSACGDDTETYTVPGFNAPDRIGGQLLVIFPIGKRAKQ